MEITSGTTIEKFTVRLGKIAYYGPRKIHAVEIEVELRTGKNTVAPYLDIDLNPCPEYTELSMSGVIWNGPRTDCLTAGQNIGDIAERFKGSRKVHRLAEIWRRWHLNGMKAGTRSQTEHLEKNRVKVQYPASQYDADCEVLQKAGLLKVTGGPEIPNANGAMVRREYTYGTAWLCEPLPQEIAQEVRELCRATL